MVSLEKQHLIAFKGHLGQSHNVLRMSPNHSLHLKWAEFMNGVIIHFHKQDSLMFQN